MSKVRKIDEVRMENIKLEGVTKDTTVKELSDMVSAMAEALRKREQDERRLAAKEAAVNAAKSGGTVETSEMPIVQRKTAFPKKKPLPDYLAQNVTALHVSDDRSIVVFENGYVYSRNESNEIVVRLEDCCKSFLNTPDFSKYIDPRQMSYEERQMCTVSAEDMQAMPWELAVIIVADRDCRYNNEHGSKGDRFRADNMVETEEGEETDLFEIYYDKSGYVSIEDGIVGSLEAERLRGIVFEKMKPRNRKIMEGVIAEKPYEQIAAEIGTTRDTVKTTVCRARKAMQKRVVEDRKKNS